ncbi:MAG: class I SAM-dependent methyltransferase [Bacteroidota bacterium]
MKDLVCSICSSANVKDYMDVKSYKITKCNCCHIQVNPIPDDKTLMSLYQHNDNDSFYGNSCSVTLLERSKLDKSFLQRYYSERIDVINKHINHKDGKIMDFGCTNGVFVQSIVDSGFEHAYGYDIAEELVEEGKKNGLKLFAGNLEEFANSFNGFFDMILSYHVFEHLPSPKNTIIQMHKCLKKGGFIYINVPHINSLQVKILKEKSAIIDPPFHLHYFTKKSMVKLLEENGFEVVSIVTPFWEKNTDTYLELNGYSHKTAVFLRYLVAPIRGIIKLFSLGGTIAVVARKK